MKQATRLGSREGDRANHFNLLRMLAATGVLVSHAYPISLGPDAVQPLEAWLQGTTLGAVCVYVFFAISGYFITRSFAHSPSWSRFLAARALRLFPALLVVLCVTVLASATLLSTAAPGLFWSEVPGYLASNLTLFRLDYDLPGVFEANPYGVAINGSLWTLFYEVLCYMGVFLAGLLGILHRPRAFGSLLVVILALCLAMPALPVPDRLDTLAQLGLPFTIGAGFWLLRDRLPLSPLAALGLFGIAALTHGTPAFLPALTLALSYAIFVLGYWPSRIFESYNRLGDYSYGMYIYAFPIQQIVASNGVTDPLLNICLALPLTLLCAVLSWKLVERPALQLKPRARPHAASRRDDGTRRETGRDVPTVAPGHRAETSR